jgi:hypothetical protein
MVDCNKFKIVDEHCKRLDNQLQTYHLEWQESMTENKEQGAKIEQLVIQMELLSSQFQQFVAAQTARTETTGGQSRGILATPGMDKNVEMNASIEKITPGLGTQSRWEQMTGQELHKTGFHIPLPRMELSTFRGEDPRGWLRKCKKYFKIHSIPVHQWVEVVSYYLEGKADVWFEGLVRGNDSHIKWEEFSQDLCRRFGSQDDIVKEFNKLIQDGNMDEYIEKFEEMRSLMGALNPLLPEAYYVSSFISGLKDEIKPMLKILKPARVMVAFEQARWQEEANNALTKKTRSLQRSHPPLHNGRIPCNVPSKYFSSSRTEGVKPPSDSLYEQRKRLGQCFRCGDKYMPGHRCNAKSLHMIEGVEGEEDEGMREFGDNVQGVDKENDQVDEYGMSLNALADSDTYNTIRIKGNCQGQNLVILIDSGSTYSFINKGTIKALKASTSKTTLLAVTVANENVMLCESHSPAFTWFMQDYEFKSNLRVLELGRHDIMLGVDWLKKYSPVLFDFIKLRLSFKKDGRMIELKGISQGAELQVINTLKEQRSFKDVIGGLVGQFFAMNSEGEHKPTETRAEIKSLLAEFAGIFEKSRALPPARRFDHKIPLKLGSQPINIRPYKSSFIQKGEIEKLVKEMISNGVIQHSVSPFASPVLLVKKKDNTWRFCIDYRQLNEQTIKNKFPIPLIDDLLDELHGSSFFSKLDLRSGYHQVRMHEEDIEKTAFRTHHGHYEFRAMPFGLTNAPATFQALMNSILEPYLRKFVLVFFDDILIYSPSFERHLVHLRQVLETLSDNQLLANRSKCAFGEQQVEYLGHVISITGVATDWKKTEAVNNWPIPQALKELKGFLGLAGYYRNFIRHFGVISKPLTELLKKNNFGWNDQSQQAFDRLKKALCEAPVLALPDFSKTFVLETDACDYGLGAVLSQECRPIAYFSKALSPKHMGLSIYEKEYLAILMAVEKWRHYLEQEQFIIQTDHESLKFLLDQKIHTTIQKKGLTKLLGLCYTILYRKGKENIVADALSRKHHNNAPITAVGELDALTSILPAWYEEVHTSYDKDPKL